MNIVSARTDKFIEPLGAKQARHLEWDEQFHMARNGVKRTEMSKNDDKSSSRSPNGRRLQQTPEMPSKQDFSNKGELNTGSQHSTAKSVVYSRGGIAKYDSLQAEMIRTAGNAVAQYRSMETNRIKIYGSEKYIPVMGPRISLRMLKMGKRSYRLGLIVYGATQGLLMKMRELVKSIIQSKGVVTSGYVNGVNCTGDEDK